jgi:hypothetical protein
LFLKLKEHEEQCYQLRQQINFACQHRLHQINQIKSVDTKLKTGIAEGLHEPLMKIVQHLLISDKNTFEQLTPEEKDLWTKFETSDIYRFLTGEEDTVPEFQYNWTTVPKLQPLGPTSAPSNTPSPAAPPAPAPQPVTPPSPGSSSSPTTSSPHSSPTPHPPQAPGPHKHHFQKPKFQNLILPELPLQAPLHNLKRPRLTTYDNVRRSTTRISTLVLPNLDGPNSENDVPEQAPQ